MSHISLFLVKICVICCVQFVLDKLRHHINSGIYVAVYYAQLHLGVIFGCTWAFNLQYCPACRLVRRMFLQL